MRLTWFKSSTTIMMHMSNGEIIEWSGAVWSRVGAALNDSVFTVLNEYWKTIPKEQLSRFESIYRNIKIVFNDRDDPHIANQRLKPLVGELLSLFNWQQFRLWCLLHGNMFLDSGVKETLDDKDRVGLTYYTEDYTDAVVFSTMLKSVLPIWGDYHEELTESIGKFYVHIEAINLIRSPYVSNIPAMLKLESYIECFTEIKIKRPGYSLMSGIGTEEIPAFLLSLALIKKVAIFNVQDPDGNIVKNVYHLLSERCIEITKVRPNEKKDVDTEGSDLAIADRYKIVQRVPPAFSTMVEYYTSNVFKIAYDIDPRIPPELVDKYNKSVLPSLRFLNLHLPIIGLVTGEVIKARTLKLIPGYALLNVIRAVSAVLEFWGYLEIAELLTVTPTTRDIYQLSSSMVGNRSYAQLRPDLANEMTLLYPFLSNGKNPGLALIDSVIKEITKYEWRVRSDKFGDVRNSIAELLIKQLGVKNAAAV